MKVPSNDLLRTVQEYNLDKLIERKSNDSLMSASEWEREHGFSELKDFTNDRTNEKN